MKTYNNLWKILCSYDNLYEAYRKARKCKTRSPSVVQFSKNVRLNLCVLLRELHTKTYRPRQLKKFVLREPKTRVISVSDFRDRIVHHALINILQPIFEPRFISDSFANRKKKGTLPAIKRFEVFKAKVSKNNTRNCFVLKCDIRHYFDTVDHEVLLSIIGKHVKDTDVLWLARSILENHASNKREKGMPLGNWTSQFFANVYLNELDQFVKHQLHIKHYIRYVDDFVILHQSYGALQDYLLLIKRKTDELKLALHQGKCRIIPLDKGTPFLGYRIFRYHKLVRKANRQKIKSKIRVFNEQPSNFTDHRHLLDVVSGWCAYAMYANTYRLRKQLYASAAFFYK